MMDEGLLNRAFLFTAWKIIIDTAFFFFISKITQTTEDDRQKIHAYEHSEKQYSKTNV